MENAKACSISNQDAKLAHMSFAPDAADVTRQSGPRDRETFYKAQKRNRRATWRIAALCFVAALVMGIPLTLVLTPLAYALTLALAEVINYFSPLPPEFWTTVNGLSHLALSVGDYFINHRGTLDLETLAAGLVVMLAPFPSSIRAASIRSLTAALCRGVSLLWPAVMFGSCPYVISRATIAASPFSAASWRRE